VCSSDLLVIVLSQTMLPSCGKGGTKPWQTIRPPTERCVELEQNGLIRNN
jgi:hypothetical protein